jgi:D-inositol-3-phosphate glycosyltransferase
MKIALVTQHANPLHPRAGASPRPDDAGLSELTRTLARQGHRVTVYAQKLSQTRRTRRRPARRAHPGRRGRQAGDTEPPAHVPVFSDPLRARWRRERPDVVHAVSWTSGLPALMATRDLGIPVVQAFSSLGVAEQRDRASADPATPPPARLRLELAIGRLPPSSQEQSPRRPGSSPTRAHSPRTSATPDPEARHVSAPTPVPSS